MSGACGSTQTGCRWERFLIKKINKKPSAFRHPDQADDACCCSLAKYDILSEQGDKCSSYHTGPYPEKNG